MSEQNQAAFGPAPEAIYLNKRNIVRIDFLTGHKLGTHTDGWRFEFTEPGKIYAVTTNSPNATFDVHPGDYLLCRGEDMYLSLLQPTTIAGEGGGA